MTRLMTPRDTAAAASRTTAPAATAPVPSTRRTRAARVGRWLLALSIVGSILVSIWSMERVPDAAWQPAVLGLVPWVIGKYLLCPLRWHSLSVAGQTRRWHIRAYAESELIGLASPAHIGADVWRMHRLKDTGMTRPCAVAEVGLDRLVGTLGVGVFVLVSGAALPREVLLLAAGIAVALVVAGLVLHRMRPGLLAARPMPRPRVVVKGIVISMGYQLTIMGLVIGSVAAMGQQVDPLALLGIFGASQLAGAVPGVHGASPREGALVVGLASLGVSWTAALGAVALAAVLAWLPALLLGGMCLGMRRLRPTAPLPA
jgi:hypothetical protein